MRLPAAIALMHAAPHVHRVAPIISSLSALYDFEGSGATAALEAWERIDDVIMGGVSSSRLARAEDSGGGTLFEGRLRALGFQPTPPLTCQPFQHVS